jgi:CheY-like chemotaxis protein
MKTMADGLSILLVEDNPDDQLLTVRALKKVIQRPHLVIAADGQEALDVLFGPVDGRGLAERLSVILLDIKLPRVDGLEVLRRIRSNPSTRYLPVVMVTSTDEPNEIREAYTLGANSYITKPVDFKVFARQMGVLADYWLAINHPPPSPLPAND